MIFVLLSFRDVWHHYFSPKFIHGYGQSSHTAPSTFSSNHDLQVVWCVANSYYAYMSKIPTSWLITVSCNSELASILTISGFSSSLQGDSTSLLTEEKASKICLDLHFQDYFSCRHFLIAWLPCAMCSKLYPFVLNSTMQWNIWNILMPISEIPLKSLRNREL